MFKPERWSCWYTLDQCSDLIGFTNKMKNMKAVFFWRCAIFRLAKPAFFKYVCAEYARENSRRSIGVVRAGGFVAMSRLQKIDARHRAAQLLNDLPESLTNMELFNVFKNAIKGRALDEFLSHCDWLSIGVIMNFSKFSAPTIAFLAFWLAKKLRLWANSRSFTSYGK